MVSPERNDNLISRRDFVIGGGVLLIASTIFGIKAFDKIQSRYLPSTPEAQDLDPQLALLGAIAVYEGANIRTSPAIPDKTRFRKPDNTIDWQEIEKVNGIRLNGAKAFVIANALAVKGQFVGHFFDNPAINHQWLDEKVWIKINVERKGKGGTTPAYISYSSQTNELVTPLNYIEPRGVYTDQVTWPNRIHILDRSINESFFGLILVPKNPQTVAQEIMPDLWANRIRPKLEGRAFLPQGERIVENVEVVAFGNTWAQLVSMKEAGTPVNVRDHPGTYYVDAQRPIYYLNGEQTRILGVVNQGTKIKRVLESGGFDAFKFADLEGPLLDQEGRQVNLLPDKICAIWSYYLA